MEQPDANLPERSPADALISPGSFSRRPRTTFAARARLETGFRGSHVCAFAMRDESLSQRLIKPVKTLSTHKNHVSELALCSRRSAETESKSSVAFLIEYVAINKHPVEKQFFLTGANIVQFPLIYERSIQRSQWFAGTRWNHGALWFVKRNSGFTSLLRRVFQ